MSAAPFLMANQISRGLPEGAGACDNEPKAEELHLRLADQDDLDQITDVAQAAFPDDPEFNYRFPYRDKYPEDNRKWVRKEYEEYLAQPEKYAVLVATVPKKCDGKVVKRVVALAVWDINVLAESTGGDLGLDTRRDVNKKHFEEFMNTLDKAFKKYFSKYGGQQYHLWLLATHPDFRNRGAGTMLTKWGMNKATDKTYKATVFGSIMGKKLYEYLGFEDLGTVTVQVEGEDDKLTISCQEYPKNEKE